MTDERQTESAESREPGDARPQGSSTKSESERAQEFPASAEPAPVEYDRDESEAALD